MTDLIDELAPSGITYKPLGELCTVFNGYAFKSDQFNSEGIGLPLIRIRDVNTGLSDTFFSGEYDARWLVEPGDILIGMDGDFRANRWKHSRALLNQRVCRLQDFSEELLPAFAFYQIQGELDRIQSSIGSSTVKHLSSRELERTPVPVPPVEVQREIVRILDQFTELEVELEAELEARRRQYYHYQTVVFSLSDQAPYVPLGDVISGLRTGLNPRQNFRLNTPDARNYYITVRELGGFDVVPTAKTDRVNDDALATIQNRSRLKAGDVLFSGTGTIGRTALVPDGEIGWNVKEGVYVLTPVPDKISARFLIHLLRTPSNRERIMAAADGSTVASVSMASLRNISIPLPELSVQAHIVAVLDKFEALVNGLNVGLPAELAARRKQYEYYRDKLLTFEEAPA
ncbi:type I restriction enzyme S subunit [Curtobacterium flaccumfaciens]|uniref:Type I restriction enzyme S subunit n=1 Tax=Curtobacterium salicis TaxID=1779862 RepID=A0ABX0T8B5_9MICO|nr:type I restriction enzyme S subunit [Curtobacterium sp. WW7]